MRKAPAATALLACIALFVVLELVAMRLYPGGTWWDLSTRGHRFWQNFLCDLEWRVALDGQPNPGALFAAAAMLSLVLGFALFWWIVPRLFSGHARLGRTVRAIGWISVAGMVAVTLMPSERFGALHGVAVVVAGLPGLTAALLATVALLRHAPRPRVPGTLGAATLLVSLADFLLYARTMLYGGPGPLALPAAEKIALLLLLAWMAVVARDVTETPDAP